jgi:hypothetical protein
MTDGSASCIAWTVPAFARSSRVATSLSAPVAPVPGWKGLLLAEELQPCLPPWNGTWWACRSRHLGDPALNEEHAIGCHLTSSPERQSASLRLSLSDARTGEAAVGYGLDPALQIGSPLRSDAIMWRQRPTTDGSMKPAGAREEELDRATPIRKAC